MNAEERLAALGLTLPTPAMPVGAYVPIKRVGELLFVSGHGPKRADGTFVTGKVGRELDLDEAREAARLAGLTLLATLDHELGSLTKVSSIVKLVGIVSVTSGFMDIPLVLDGCSDLFLEVFGETGRHTRVAMGVSELPLGIPVEVEVIATVT